MNPAIFARVVGWIVVGIGAGYVYGALFRRRIGFVFWRADLLFGLALIGGVFASRVIP